LGARAPVSLEQKDHAKTPGMEPFGGRHLIART
jgi:hypothetical protein